jgi:hypothetical protein
MHNHSARIVYCSFGGTFCVRRRLRSLMVLATLLLVATATPVVAGPITLPTSLSPGDSYRLAFVSSTSRDATSSNVADYNAFVTGVANAVQELFDLGTTWTAIASTASVDARVNTDTLPLFAGGSLGVPIFLLNDTKLVDNYDDLWDGSIDPPLQMGLDITENGVFGYPFGASVWTGTGPDGSAFPDGGVPEGRALGTDFPQFGETSPSSPERWISAQGFFSGLNSKPFYGLSGVLTAPAAMPEPNSVFLMAIGAVGLIRYRWRLKRKKASAS